MIVFTNEREKAVYEYLAKDEQFLTELTDEYALAELCEAELTSLDGDTHKETTEFTDGEINGMRLRIIEAARQSKASISSLVDRLDKSIVGNSEAQEALQELLRSLVK